MCDTYHQAHLNLSSVHALIMYTGTQNYKFFIVHISPIPFCYLTQVKTALTANIKYLLSKLFCGLRHEVSSKNK